MIPSPLQRNQIIKLRHDAAYLKMANDLIEVHKKFISKLEEVNTAINKKTGPMGPKGATGREGPQGPRGLSIKGPKGDSGKDGKDAIININEVIASILGKIQIPKGEKGDPGAPAMITGKHIDMIAEKAAKKIKVPKPEKPDPLSIIEEIMKMPEGKKLSTKHIDGLEQTLSAFRSQLARGYLHGGGDTVLAGTNITITKNANGAKIINASGGAFPQMTTAQRLALSPINGQTAYDTDLNVAMIYVNGNWGTVLLN